MRFSFKTQIIDYLLIISGVISAGFGLKGFLLPNHFIDGGAVGVSLLISHVSGFSLSILLIIINLPFIILGFINISKEFSIKTTIGIILLSLAVAFFPYPQITNDKLLVSVFGGFFLGAGIGLAVRGGGVIDGTEVLALSMSKKLGISIGDIILIINIIIFSVAAYILSIETALYSILTYLAASKTVDYIIEGIEEYTGVTIISNKHELIRHTITSVLGYGVTVYKAERGLDISAVTAQAEYDDINLKVLFTVITRLEIRKLKNEIEKIDPNAFIIMQSVNDTRGGMIKKRTIKD